MTTDLNNHELLYGIVPSIYNRRGALTPEGSIIRRTANRYFETKRYRCYEMSHSESAITLITRPTYCIHSDMPSCLKQGVSPRPLFSRHDNVDNRIYGMFGQFREYQDCITQLPQALIDELGTGFLVEGLPERITVEFPLLSKSIWQGSQEVHRNEVFIDHLSSISLLSESIAEQVKSAMSAPKYKTLRVRNLFRGKTGFSTEIKLQTKKQVLTGSRFFTFKHRVKTILGGGRTEDRIMISLGSFDSLEKMLKFGRSSNFLLDLIQAFVHTDQMQDFMNNSSTSSKIRLGRWWSGIDTHIKGVTEERARTLMWDIPKERLAEGSHLNNEHFQALHYQTRSNNSAEARKLKRMHEKRQKVCTKVQHAVQRLKHYRTVINDEHGSIDNLRIRIESFEREIVRRKTVVEDYTRLMEEKRTALNVLETTLDVLEEATKQAQVAHTEAVKKMETEDKEDIDWFKNFLESGILVLDIVYKNLKSAEIRSILEDASLTSNPDWKLCRVEYATTKPLKITVGEIDAPIDERVGGPYHIEVSQEGAQGTYIRTLVKPASLDAVVAIRKTIDGELDLRAHPHIRPERVGPFLSDIAHWGNNWHSVCAGEMEPALHHAFNSKQPNYVIYAVLGWLTSCNPEDEYGQSYKNFVKPSEVRWTEIPETEKSEVLINTPDVTFKRYLEQRTGSRQKFWEVTVNGNEYTTRWGVIGEEGKANTRSWGDSQAAIAAARTALTIKLGSGYKEVPQFADDSIVSPEASTESTEALRNTVGELRRQQLETMNNTLNSN